MKVREANVKDIEELSELLIQAQELHCKNRPDVFKSMTKKEAEEEITEVIENQDKKMIVTVNDNNKVCGFVSFKIKKVENYTNLKDSNILYICKIVVNEKSRRKGTGSLLIQEMYKIAKELKCNRIELNCWDFNQGAIEFYKSQGMEIQRLNMEIKIGG